MRVTSSFNPAPAEIAMYRIVTLLFLATFSAIGVAADIQGLSNADAVAGLKQALMDGSAAAVAQLGKANGFLDNPKVKIPLPPTLQRVESALRFAGMKQQADDLVTAMNHAAEAAVPEAKPLLLDAVKKMSVQDAKGILTGGDTSVTDYFRRTTQSQLTGRFLPIVKKTTDRVGLATQYNGLAGQASQLGLVGKEQASIESYVTTKALDGLYLMIGEQEKAFRQNPVGAASDIVRKVFGALR
jgi:hypothetical protein